MLVVQPKNVVFLNNLAWLNLESNNLDKALKYSNLALKLAPEHPNVIDTRGMVLLKSGRKVDAWKTVLKAYTLTKGKDEKIALNYAEILILNKQLEEARKVLTLVTLNSPDIKKRKNSLLSLIK
jgi:Flp pilus assembly protein TadD